MEVRVLAATLVLHEGHAIPSASGDDISISTYCHRMLPALAEVIPVATRHATNVYAREPLKLLFAMDGRATKAIPSARGMQ